MCLTLTKITINGLSKFNCKRLFLLLLCSIGRYAAGFRSMTGSFFGIWDSNSLFSAQNVYFKPACTKQNYFVATAVLHRIIRNFGYELLWAICTYMWDAFLVTWVGLTLMNILLLLPTSTLKVRANIKFSTTIAECKWLFQVPWNKVANTWTNFLLASL